MAPNFEFEKPFWGEGRVVCGVDEVGRGSFAGPLVAGAVVVPQMSKLKFQIPNEIRIDDSKKLSRKQREEASVWIKKMAISWAIGEVSVREINNFGMARSLKLSYKRAVRGLGQKVDKILLDGKQGIVRGDSKSFSIACASIIAKVHRDKILCDLGEKSRYSAYLWNKNMGYGTEEHREAILKHGITKYHRKVFVETWLSNFSSSQAL